MTNAERVLCAGSRAAMAMGRRSKAMGSGRAMIDTRVARGAGPSAACEGKRHLAGGTADHRAQQQAAFAARGKHEIARRLVQSREGLAFRREGPGLRGRGHCSPPVVLVQSRRNTANWLAAIRSARRSRDEPEIGAAVPMLRAMLPAPRSGW